MLWVGLVTCVAACAAAHPPIHTGYAAMPVTQVEAPREPVSGHDRLPAPTRRDEAAMDDALATLPDAIVSSAPRAQGQPRAALLAEARANGGNIWCADRRRSVCFYSPRPAYDTGENFSLRRRIIVDLPPPRESLRRNPDVVIDFVRRQEPRMRGCFQSALLANPSADTQVELAWTIDGTGAVSNLTCEVATPGSESMQRCLKDVIGGLDLAPIAGADPVRLHVPFHFARDEASERLAGTRNAAGYVRGAPGLQ
ncbi:MAG: AgmX/PglI C-terminal domain-containing protein [Deltaproteobacteria bacterium]